MTALNRLDIAQTLCQELEIELKVAKCFVNHFFLVLSQTLAKGETVQLSGFGQFMLRDKSKRMGRNPRTKQPAVITARRVVTFKPSKVLKKQLYTHGG